MTGSGAAGNTSACHKPDCCVARNSPTPGTVDAVGNADGVAAEEGEDVAADDEEGLEVSEADCDGDTEPVADELPLGEGDPVTVAEDDTEDVGDGMWL